MGKNGEIGLNGIIPWDLEADRKRFKYLTIGKNVLMGRKTFDSLPTKLDGRKVFVISKELRTVSSKGDDFSYPIFVNSLEDITAGLGNSETLLVSGGREIYEMTYPLIDDIFLTFIDKAFEADTYYYSMEKLLNDFEIEYERHFDSPFSYSFMRLVRRRNGEAGLGF